MIVVTFLTYGALDSLCIWSAALKLKFSFAAGGHVSLGGNGSSARVSRDNGYTQVCSHQIRSLAGHRGYVYTYTSSHKPKHFQA